jgi:hypothetical protein
MTRVYQLQDQFIEVRWWWKDFLARRIEFEIRPWHRQWKLMGVVVVSRDHRTVKGPIRLVDQTGIPRWEGQVTWTPNSVRETSQPMAEEVQDLLGRGIEYIVWALADKVRLGKSEVWIKGLQPQQLTMGI